MMNVCIVPLCDVRGFARDINVYVKDASRRGTDPTVYQWLNLTGCLLQTSIWWSRTEEK